MKEKEREQLVGFYREQFLYHIGNAQTALEKGAFVSRANSEEEAARCAAILQELRHA